MTAFGKLIRTTAFRLVAIYLLIFFLFAGFLLGYIAWNARQVVSAQVRANIETEINGLAEQYRGGGARRLAHIIDRRSRQARGFFYLLADGQNEVISSNIADPKSLQGLSAGWHEMMIIRSFDDAPDDRVPARVQVLNLPNGLKLAVGHDIEEQARMRQVIRRAGGMSLILVLLLGGIGAWVVSRRVLRPVDNMTAAASRIMAGNLSERLPVRGVNDEFDRLAEHINLMLNRIGELMNGLRAVSDNVAHDLRTPLTRLRASSEEALRTAKTPEELRGALERTIEESDGLIKVFNALLMIARAEGGSAPAAFTDIDLARIVADVVELYEPVAEEAGLTLANEVNQPVPFHGSRELLSQAIANLVDNAIKYGRPVGDTPPEPLKIALSQQSDALELTVADHGAGIPSEDRERVLDRFVRLEKSRALPGSGLGLSLVAAIARLHGGKLRLEDNAPGIKAVLSLPARKQTQE